MLPGEWNDFERTPMRIRRMGTEALAVTKLRNHRHARRAFSLIELLIVLAILLPIGGIVAVNVLPKKDQADIDTTRVQIDSIESAIQLFKLDFKRFPTEEEGIAVLWDKNAIEDEDEMAKWKSAYLETPLPRDTWDNEWIYREESEQFGTSMYDLISIGPDGEEGTEDDLSNHDDKLDEDGEVKEDFDDFGDGDLG